ncbi:MAG: hypothetical protein ACPGSC_12675, partial [Granulosicoccaceae bacterium]
MRQTSGIKSLNALQRLMATPLGDLLARSWLDRYILRSLEHWFFPLSRLWAAARKAHGDPRLFFDAVPMSARHTKLAKVERALADFDQKRIAVQAAESQWLAGFFGDQAPAEQELVRLENHRLDRRNEYNATRRHFFFLRKHVNSSVYHAFSTPAQMREIYPDDEQAFSARFDPPSCMPDIQCSASIPTQTHRAFWLRFDCPSERLEGQVYAKVLEPLGVENPPTLIYGHGIGVEFDHWRNLIDVADLLPQLGIRVIRPEAPWHGRRVLDGYYGGEYFLSSAPMGGADFFTAQHQEWAVLMDWARRTSSGPVGMGGCSLGAQSAQMTATRARHWPAHLQPDALLLLTHCAYLWEVALDGDLADIWGLHEPLLKSGWSRPLIEQQLA